MLASVGGEKRDTNYSVLRKVLALTFAVLSWVSHAALVAAVADQNYRASVIEAFSVFIVSLHFIQRSPVVYSEVSEKGV